MRQSETEPQSRLDVVEQSIDQVDPGQGIRSAQRGVLIGGAEWADRRQAEAVERRITA